MRSPTQDEVNCPMCKTTPSKDNTKTMFNRCKWSFKVRRADGKKKEGAQTDTGAHGFVEMPSGTGERRSGGHWSLRRCHAKAGWAAHAYMHQTPWLIINESILLMN